MVVSEQRLRDEIQGFRLGVIAWPKRNGPQPGSPGCLVPAYLLHEGAAPVSFSGGRPRVTFHLLGGIPAIPPRQNIVEGLFQPGELVVLVGAPKAGKSALAVHLAAAVGSGTPFLGRITSRGAVAYAALERHDETVRRLRAIGADALPVFASSDRPAFADDADVVALIEALQATATALRPDLPLRLVIIDTARKAFRGLRENDADSVSVGLEAIRRVMRAVPKAALVLIHHLNKEGSSARGSGAILADADLELTVDVEGRSGRRMLEVTAANAIEEGQVLPFDLVPVLDEDGQSVISARAAATPPAPLLLSDGVHASSRLPGDASIALAALNALGPSGVQVSQWREETFKAFGERAHTAKKVAWGKARKLLFERGAILIEGDTVSVSAGGKQSVSAYAPGGVSAPVSAAPLIGGPLTALTSTADEPDEPPS